MPRPRPTGRPGSIAAPPEPAAGPDRRRTVGIRSSGSPTAGSPRPPWRAPRTVACWSTTPATSTRELRRRTHVWVELLRDDDPRRKSTTRLQIFGREFRLGGLWLDRTPEQSADYYELNPASSGRSAAFLGEADDSLDGVDRRPPAARDRRAGLRERRQRRSPSSPPSLFRAMLSTSAEVDSAAWLALVGVAVLFAEIYLVAAGIAVFMIFGLSRAVNRLSRATEAIGRGDFSTRIPVRRKDQLGDLQRSFNSMSEHLEELVQTAAQKEALDKELALARQVQQDLLPAGIDERPGVEFSTFFEPSAAIGGDYFDILDAGDGRVAVVVADVAGHGLAAGLRMALVKSALTLLVEDRIAAPAILARLHRLLRSKPGERSFVTASLSLFDPATGAPRAHQRRPSAGLRRARGRRRRRTPRPGRSARRAGSARSAAAAGTGADGAGAPGALSPALPSATRSSGSPTA